MHLQMLNRFKRERLLSRVLPGFGRSPAAKGVYGMEWGDPDYVERLTGLPHAEAYVLQKKYLEEHGLTLRGLMLNHDVDPDEYHAMFADVSLEVLAHDPALAERCQRVVQLADGRVTSDRLTGDRESGDRLTGGREGGDRLTGDREAGDRLAQPPANQDQGSRTARA